MKIINANAILEEIRRQAFIRADQRRREAEIRRETRYTLDALQELTGLPRRELETIAANVKACYYPEERDFFSVGNQFRVVSSSLVLIGFILWVTIRLFL